MKREWTVHPNRSEVGADESGRNGHYRAVSQPRPPAAEPFLARVELPRTLSHLADLDGTVTFGGFDWRFVVGAARTFARVHTDIDVPPPFGFKRSGLWHWWDGSTSIDSIVEGPGAAEHVRRYLQRLYPRATIELAVRAPN
ncbi:hypothetical protein [Mycolicibacterium tusciae]|uniref:hypothetical protein n=1 Tax=Mycolicibacterium tusciae TaxID=75922 RepID=UPI00024A5095|nr:hypothetical protein [Mycolicibacterium tusciae]